MRTGRTTVSEAGAHKLPLPIADNLACRAYLCRPTACPTSCPSTKAREGVLPCTALTKPLQGQRATGCEGRLAGSGRLQRAVAEVVEMNGNDNMPQTTPPPSPFPGSCRHCPDTRQASGTLSTPPLSGRQLHLSTLWPCLFTKTIPPGRQQALMSERGMASAAKSGQEAGGMFGRQQLRGDEEEKGKG